MRSLRRSAMRALTVSMVAAVVLTGTTFVAPSAHAVGDLDKYLNLPLVNRDADHGPGGVHLSLPTDPSVLRKLLDEARDRGSRRRRTRHCSFSTGWPTPPSPRAST